MANIRNTIPVSVWCGKKRCVMAEQKAQVLSEDSDEYEILPHKEIHELREQLYRLKERPTERTLQLAMAETAMKMDRLINIFEESLTMIKVEEGSLSFTEKLRPLMEKMDKILEQNSEIAAGLVGIHDIMVDVKESIDKINEKPAPQFQSSPIGFGMGMPGQVPPPGMQMGAPAYGMQAQGMPAFPPPPPPRR